MDWKVVLSLIGVVLFGVNQGQQVCINYGSLLHPSPKVTKAVSHSNICVCGHARCYHYREIWSYGSCNVGIGQDHNNCACTHYEPKVD